jgi:hypothetical protein
MHFELQFRRQYSFGKGIALNAGLTNCVVQAFIREQHLVLLDMVIQAAPSLLPVHTAHLEYVREVGAISHAEWH